MKFIQHIPSMVTTDEPATEFEFETVEQLLSHPDIEDYKHEGFYKFSIDECERKKSIALIAEYDKGKKWWVVGFIYGGIPEGLPNWIPNENDEDEDD